MNTISDYSEYCRMKNLLKEHVDYQPGEDNVTKEAENLSNDSMPTEQEGQGNSSRQNDEMQPKLKKMAIKFAENIVSALTNAPPIPSHIERQAESSPDFQTNDVRAVFSGTGESQMSSDQVLSSLPKRFQRKGRLLLRKLEDVPGEVSFDQTGTLYIDGNAIDNSDIKQIIHATFTTRKKPVGLPEFLNVLHRLGLSEFINEKRKLSKTSCTTRSHCDSTLPQDWYCIV